MIRHSFQEAFRLADRAKKESAIYLASCLFCALLFILVCMLLGISYDYRNVLDVLKGNFFKGTLALVPGGLVGAWFSAGLSGYIAMDAFTGAPENMTRYAKGWYVRNLAGGALVSGSFLALMYGFYKIAASLNMVLFIGAMISWMWLMIRVTLWLPAMFIEGLGPIAAMKRSFSLSSGKAPVLAVMMFASFLPVWVIEWILGKVMPGQVVLAQVIRALLEGAVTIIITGAFATAYITLKNNKAAPVAVPGDAPVSAY